MIMKDKETVISEEFHDFDSLVSIMALLRGEGGCPWDREQTHASIRKCLIEETYEAVEAIDNDDKMLMREELGDLIFQAVFHSQIEAENGEFTIDNVIDDVCKKMIRRHPHIFGDKNIETAEGVGLSWDEIKKKEKKNGYKSPIISAPAHLPALLKAQKVHSKLKKYPGYGFATRDDAVRHAIEHIESVPDAVFALAAVAEFDGIDAEKELDATTNSFISQLGNN